jgi:hypothetical protein
MAREFKGKLTADDLAYLRQRYPESYVQRMADLHGVKKSADTDEEVEAAQEAARKAQEEADAAAAAEADKAQREADDTEAEVKEWASSASDEDKAKALASEQARTDREPRKGVVSLLS